MTWTTSLQFQPLLGQSCALCGILSFNALRIGCRRCSRNSPFLVQCGWAIPSLPQSETFPHGPMESQWEKIRIPSRSTHAFPDDVWSPKFWIQSKPAVQV